MKIFLDIIEYLCSDEYLMYSLLVGCCILFVLIVLLEKEVGNLNCKFDQLSGYYLGLRDEMNNLTCVSENQEKIGPEKIEENEQESVE